MLDIFIQLSLLILAVLVIAFIIRLLKQPIIIAYILTGILLSSFFLNIAVENETVLTLSQFGVAFLLFIVGLHLNPRVIKEVGFASLIIGLIQIIFTSLAGFLLAFYLLHFSFLISLYIAFALTFSSTIIITKILSDKSDLDSLYGKISVGILILQDIVVIAILIVLSYFSEGASFNIQDSAIFYSILYIILGVIVLVFASIYVLPTITKFVAKNQELLFLFSVGWVFILASLFFKLGLSLEIGALLAGMSLSLSPYHAEIASKIRPLRDFFIIIFFVLLGLQVNINNISGIIKPALILSAFVILFKFFILMISLGLLGYSKRTSFLTSTSLGQISEFSFIMVALGVSLGHITSEILSMITLTGLITIAFSTYMMIFSNKIFSFFSPVLSIFERKKIKERGKRRKVYDYILFGYNRMGFSVLKSFVKKKNYIVIDYDPETVKKLTKQNINIVYGDAEDTEFLQDLGIDKAKLVLSTIPSVEINLLILNKIRKTNPKSIIILTSHQIADAFKLYEQGADYIILPHFLGGQYVTKMIERFKTKKKKYEKEKQNQIKSLKERIKAGHEHPKIE